MPTFLNEHFAENMTGKRISYDVQPYEHGTGTITKITPRQVKVQKEFHPERGGQTVTYECYDLEIAVEEGRHVGALIAGVPIQTTIRDMKGKTGYIVGVSYGQIYRATREKDPQPIVIARCG